MLKSSPSHFSNSLSVLTPPSKTLSFNTNLKQNDGVLAVWLQNQIKCTSNEALTNLNEFAEYCKSVLSNHRRLTIEGIGFFYLDFENNTCFEPQLETNFLLDSFGLKPISLIQISETATENKKEINPVDRVGNEAININQPLKKQKKYRQIIVPLALLVAVFSLLSLLVTNTKISGKLKSAIYGKNEINSYIPLNYSELSFVTDNKINTGYVADANGIAAIEIDNNAFIAVRVMDEVKTLKKVSSSITPVRLVKHTSNNFEIVLGCFSVLDNAKRMVLKLEQNSVSANISGQNAKGMFVVSNGDFSDKNLAIAKLLEIKAVCPNAWIKKVD